MCARSHLVDVGRVAGRCRFSERQEAHVPRPPQADPSGPPFCTLGGTRPCPVAKACRASIPLDWALATDSRLHVGPSGVDRSLEELRFSSQSSSSLGWVSRDAPRSAHGPCDWIQVLLRAEGFSQGLPLSPASYSPPDASAQTRQLLQTAVLSAPAGTWTGCLRHAFPSQESPSWTWLKTCVKVQCGVFQ